MTMPAFAKYIYLAARVRPEPTSTQVGETGSKGMTTAEKLAHVERWRKSGGTKREFAKALGVTEFTFREWTQGRSLGQHGMTNVTAPEIREKALKLYRAGSTGGKIAKEMGIPEGTVRGWVTAWRQEGAI
jgi:transposase-like protein